MFIKLLASSFKFNVKILRASHFSAILKYVTNIHLDRISNTRKLCFYGTHLEFVSSSSSSNPGLPETEFPGFPKTVNSRIPGIFIFCSGFLRIEKKMI